MTNEQGTAVAEPGTAFEAPEVEIAQEAPEGIAPDQPIETPVTDDTETAETAEAETDAPEESPPDPFADLSDDDLRDHPKVKSLLAREGESTRQRTERETATRLHSQRQQYVATGQAKEDLTGLLVNAERDEAGRPQIDSDRFEQITGDLMSSGSAAAVNVVASVLSELAGDGFAFEEGEQEVVDAALSRYYQNPADPSALIRAWLKPYARAQTSLSRDDIRKEVERDVRAEYKARDDAAKAKQATEGRKQSPGATNVNGGATSTRYTSQSAANAAHARGDMSTDDYRALVLSGEYARLP